MIFISREINARAQDLVAHREQITWLGRVCHGWFFHTRVETRLMYYEFRVEISDASIGNNPIVEHQRNRPSCKFVRRIPCGHVPMGIHPDTIPVPSRRLYENDHPATLNPDFYFPFTKPVILRDENRDFLSLYDHTPPRGYDP